MGTFNLRAVKLRPGELYEGRVDIPLEPLVLGGETYRLEPPTVSGELRLVRTTSGLVFQLRFDAALVGPCTRCLDEASIPIAISVTEYEERGAESEELHSPYVVDERLDLPAWAHDSIALSLPDKLLCREDCPGLCSSCGASLAEGPCGCPTELPDARWAKLEELRERG